MCFHAERNYADFVVPLCSLAPGLLPASRMKHGVSACLLMTDRGRLSALWRAGERNQVHRTPARLNPGATGREDRATN